MVILIDEIDLFIIAFAFGINEFHEVYASINELLLFEDSFEDLLPFIEFKAVKILGFNEFFCRNGNSVEDP